MGNFKLIRQTKFAIFQRWNFEKQKPSIHPYVWHPRFYVLFATHFSILWFILTNTYLLKTFLSLYYKQFSICYFKNLLYLYLHKKNYPSWTLKNTYLKTFSKMPFFQIFHLVYEPKIIYNKTIESVIFFEENLKTHHYFIIRRSSFVSFEVVPY